MKKTVVFWGAGATASLGFRTTPQQGTFIRHLAPTASGQSLAVRVRNALGKAGVSPWDGAFVDLLTILGDGRPLVEATDVRDDALDAMARHWENRNPDEMRRRIRQLRTTYDWLALTAVIKACPGSTDEGKFKINDLFNIMDLHGQSGHGFHAEGDFLTPQQIGGARSTLKMLLQAMFFVDWQVARKAENGQLALHYDFAVALGKRMQRQGRHRAGANTVYESPHFYAGDTGFASMNYDPIGLWCQTVANRNLNKDAAVPHVGAPARKLQLFLDPAHFVAGMRIGKKPQRVWHSMGEAVVQRLNEDGHRIRTTKFLLPQGCLCWRECPNCGKLSNYWGDRWDLGSSTLIPPPPFRAFEEHADLDAALTCEERKARRRGEVDARACVHCETLTYTHHTSTQMQSSLKERPPAFLEEIQRELRVVVSKAKHIVLMGYSLPPDDVVYRAFFAAHRSKDSDVKCTVVGKREGCGRWLGPKELTEDTGLGEPAVDAARDIFGADNVRFYGGGIPEVFMEGGAVTDRAVEQLLVWQSH